MNIQNLKIAYTHNGCMHADDVFSGALLKILNPKISIVRIDRKDLTLYKNEFMFDIGGGKFDHHTINNIKRYNGIPYASFGLLMHKYYSLLGLSKESYKKLDKDFIETIDNVDNVGQSESVVSPISLIISYMNQKDIYGKEQEKAFIEAVNLAYKILKIVINKYLDNQKTIVEVRKIIKDNSAKKYLVLDKFLPPYMFKHSNIQFVIFKNKDDNYEIISTNNLKYKVNDSVIKDKIFVHPNKFMGIYKTFDTVKEVVKLSVI